MKSTNLRFTWINLFWCISFSLILTGKAVAQEFYVATLDNRLLLVDISSGSCSETLVGNLDLQPAGTFLTDICYHPDGNIYGVSSFNEIYLVDPVTAATTNLGNPGLSGQCNAMVAAADGTIYVANFLGGIFAIDIQNFTSNFLGFCGFLSAGDLTFIDGILYLVTLTNDIVEIDLDDVTNSSVVLTLPASSQIFGIVTFANDCDDAVSYATSSDLNSEIYEFTLDGDFDFICTISGQSGGAAAPNEYIASDCDLSIDLDEDDSSGALDADFNAPELCATFTSPIADTDVTITSSNSIDTILISLSAGILDGIDEIITGAGTAEISVVGSGTGEVLLINNGGASIEDFESLIQTIQYENTAAFPSPGIREINVQVFSNGISSNIAVAYVDIIEVPDAGNDNTITVCRTDSVFDLFQLLGPDADSGGVWSPPLSSGTGIFDPSTDNPGFYEYTVSGIADCPDVSALITVNLEEPPNAGLDTSLMFCTTQEAIDLLDFIRGNPDFNGSLFPETINGNTTFDPQLDLPGTYAYIVPATDFCSADTSIITILTEDPPFAGEDVVVEVCENSSSIDLLDFLAGAESNGVFIPPLSTGTTVFDPAVDAEGTYIYSVPGGAVCSGSSAIVDILFDEPVSAGMPFSLDVCSSDSVFDVIEILMPSDVNGQIAPPFAGGGTIFNPVTDTFINYQYFISANGLCPGDTTNFQINISDPPIQVTDTALQFCESADPIDVLEVLPDWPSGGSWNPVFESNSNIFDPGVDVQGTYSYTLSGEGPCADFTVEVEIEIVTEPDAGDNLDLSFCREESVIDLGDYINGSIAGEIIPSLNSGNLIFNPLVDAAGLYSYVVFDNQGCQGDTSLISIALINSVDAGIDTSIELCSSHDELSFQTLIDTTLGGVITPSTVRPWFFTPGEDAPGIYRYIVTDSICSSDTATIEFVVTGAANAGENTSLNVCPQTTAVNVFDQIPGLPDSSGFFVPGFAGIDFVFEPGVDEDDTYLYIVNGTGACPSDTAAIEITTRDEIFAGRDTTISLCDLNNQIPLNNFLGDGALEGGFWVPALASGGNNFNPQIDGPGQYTYIVDPGNGCIADSAFLRINIDTAPEAGNDVDIRLCSDADPVTLIDVLDGASASSGSFQPATVVSGQFDPSVDPSGSYLYIVEESSSCPADTAQISFIVQPLIEFGPDTLLTLCDDANSVIDLNQIANIGDSIQGMWFPSTASRGIWNSALDQPGTYVFVPASTLCKSDSISVHIELNAPPDAGTDAQITLCGQDEPIFLLEQLSGTPDDGGEWMPVTNEAGVFHPALDSAGVYTYVVNGVGVCPSDTARLNIAVEPVISLFFDTLITICESSNAIDLQSISGLSDDITGTWQPALQESGIFDPTADAGGTYTFVAEDIPCLLPEELKITVNVLSEPNAGNDTSFSVCNYDPRIDLFGLISGGTDINGRWQPESVFDPALNQEGNFQYVLENECGTDSATYSIRLIGLPELDLPQFAEICSGDTFLVQLPSSQSARYEWSDGEVGARRAFTDPGTYSVLVSDAQCFTSASINLNVRTDCDRCEVYVPNAFSPNFDGVNDTFLPLFDCASLQEYTFQILNRWGDMVFESSIVSNEWDGNFNGQLASEGVYAYVLKYTYEENGVINEAVQYGDLTLIR